jgi:hypothetical protein
MLSYTAGYKGEAKNALARSVFFNRSLENQRYRASGLNLVVAVIVLWNTVYLERAIVAGLATPILELPRTCVIPGERIPLVSKITSASTGTV